MYFLCIRQFEENMQKLISFEWKKREHSERMEEKDER